MTTLNDDQVEASLRFWSLEHRHRAARARSAEARVRYYRGLARKRGWSEDRIAGLVEQAETDALNAALRGAI